MTQIAPALSSVRDGIAAFLDHAIRPFGTPATANPDPQDTPVRHVFVLEMLSRDPEAFSSDLDVQTLMQHYPGHY